jgi:hypothetical protein
MANLVVGRVRRIDQAERVLVVGHMKFRVAEGLSLPDAPVGSKILATYVERDGRFWLTGCRLAENRQDHATHAAGA